VKTLRSALFVFAALLMASAAYAQEPKLVASIPFDFVLGDHAYPAGEYSVQSITGSNVVVLIENTDPTQRARRAGVLSQACTNILPSEKSKLVFLRMGDNLFLHQVWIQGRLSGLEFPRSKAEIRLAENHEKSKMVIVAANISK
jgi:hypothetical protein